METYINKICPTCKKSINDNEEIIICPSCNNSYHKKCWEENHGCCYCNLESKENNQLSIPDETPCTEQNSNNHTVSDEKAPKYCSNCGAPLTDGQVFCGQCGKKVGITSKSNQLFHKKYFKILLLALIILTILITGSMAISKRILPKGNDIVSPKTFSAEKKEETLKERQTSEFDEIEKKIVGTWYMELMLSDKGYDSIIYSSIPLTISSNKKGYLSSGENEISFDWSFFGIQDDYYYFNVYTNDVYMGSLGYDPKEDKLYLLADSTIGYSCVFVRK